MPGEGHDDNEVGYGKPPKKNQWAKGTSGNYFGRPRGTKKVQPPPKRSYDPVLQLILQETDRMVSVREGDAHKQMSVLEASLRRLGVEAMRGKFQAIKLLQEMRRCAETDILHTGAQMSLTVDRYKAEWEPVFAIRRLEGRAEHPQLPHPDHVRFSRDTNLMEILGPSDADQKRGWDALKSLLRSLDQKLKTAELVLLDDPKNPERLKEKKMFRSVTRRLLKLVPAGWNWQECVSDRDWLECEQEERKGKSRPD